MTVERVKFAFVALFFAVLALVGLSAGADYGLPLRRAHRANHSAKRTCWNTPCALFGEDSAPAQWYLSRGITPISQSIERDHGQCAYYLAAALLPLQEEAPDRVMVLWHAYTWVWFMLGVAAVYGFCREAKLSRPVSCRRHAAALPVSALFCRGALQQQGHGAADAVFVHAVAGAALSQAAGLSAWRAVFSGGRHGRQHQGRGFFCVGADGAVRGGAGDGTAALGPPDGMRGGRNRRRFLRGSMPC